MTLADVASRSPRWLQVQATAKRVDAWVNRAVNEKEREAK